ncbi:hypothetical protein KY290_005588 [Solanum tuberosum]|uniref:Uncharacterized protein n=1 Tax=Solanum tuberosum TaxID=4113 RepID=A0ABQ7WFY3_SOLTU|nr:hypothetical protein KY290_005588 [Solanum tuberosum]
MRDNTENILNHSKRDIEVFKSELTSLCSNQFFVNIYEVFIVFIKRLNLSWLVNVSDATVVALAEGCKNLDALNLTGCEFVTGEGVRTLTKHGSLKELILTSCEKVSGYDLEELVLGCQTLEYIGVDRRLRMWVPMEVQDNIMREHCWIDWK